MPFGNTRINFTKVKDMTLGEVYGLKDLKPTELGGKIWDVIHKNDLMKKG